MQTQLSDVALLKVIKEKGPLEIWSDRSPKTYYAGNVLIGEGGERDIKIIHHFIEQGYLLNVAADASCELYDITEKGQEYVRSFNLI